MTSTDAAAERSEEANYCRFLTSNELAVFVADYSDFLLRRKLNFKNTND